MAKEIMTTNRAVAEAVKLAKPQVVPVYPITPQTTISEYLAQFVADGDLDAELEIYMSAVGKVKFEFTGSTNVKDICKIISTYALK